MIFPFHHHLRYGLLVSKSKSPISSYPINYPSTIILLSYILLFPISYPFLPIITITIIITIYCCYLLYDYEYFFYSSLLFSPSSSPLFFPRLLGPDHLLDPRNKCQQLTSIKLPLPPPFFLSPVIFHTELSPSTTEEHLSKPFNIPSIPPSLLLSLSLLSPT